VGVIDDLFAQAVSPAPQTSSTDQLALIQALMQNRNNGGGGRVGGDHGHGSNGAHPGGGGTGPVSNAAHKLIHFAHNQVGDPYVWGATGPNGFDCSGLIYADLRHMGYNIPGNVRTAASFQHWTHHVQSRHALKPGDLVYMWYPNSRGIPRGTASHVGLYKGHGKMIAASSSAGHVQIQPVDWSAYIGGGRIPHI
jgi:peptidoglycan DL-endopeptidase CwlO